MSGSVSPGVTLWQLSGIVWDWVPGLTRRWGGRVDVEVALNEALFRWYQCDDAPVDVDGALRWVYLVVRGLVWKQRRAEKRLCRGSGRVVVLSALVADEDEPLCQAVGRCAEKNRGLGLAVLEFGCACERLSGRQREVIGAYLAAVKEDETNAMVRPRKVIAARLGLAEGTVKRELRLARGRLVEELEGYRGPSGFPFVKGWRVRDEECVRASMREWARRQGWGKGAA